MTVHFAAARTASASPVARVLTRGWACGRVRGAANDNYAKMGDDTLLSAALRHFAQHGLRAAIEARQEAERAFFAGDRDAYLWWLGVCRTLDRRMAEQMERR